MLVKGDIPVCLEGGTECHGDDIIQVEDGNMDVFVYGQGGNDKLIGGITIGDEKLYGEDGDDKIWMINPERRDLDIGGTSSFGYGGNGNDSIYGSSATDTLSGQDGDDYINGFGGDDSLEGGIGDDTLLGEYGSDNIAGGQGDDKIYGGGGSDTIFGDDQL